ncbi:uncharacterized protein M6B38_400725 [Iris pallida]|uniref:Transcription factor MYBS1 n=1 Tax=Iris pallida TaxID=29817 RepID=A0AAX6FUG1_IRIPA|nr:uncharacterized protein M6B38_400725 [Iris pallida]
MAALMEDTSSSWSWEEEKAFENALAAHPEGSGDRRWELIAEAVPGKSPEEIRHHYELLVEDVNDIESGLVPLPSYASSSSSEGGLGEDGNGGGGGGGSKKGGSRAEQERRKGIAWTEDEHRLFLLGLEKYGKGDWRSISRNFVISRTPTQVASHAQKYFIRLNSMNKDRRRASIHDITSVGGNSDVAAAQGPITGQANGPAAVPGGKPMKPSPHPPPGTAIGQPVGGGAMVPAVGTPVSLPVSGGPRLAYGVRAPVGGPVAPVNYPAHHPSAHR